jgi:hypothetical protein
VEFFDGGAARSAIPTIGEDHATVVPEQGANFRHGFLEALAAAGGMAWGWPTGLLSL